MPVPPHLVIAGNEHVGTDLVPAALSAGFRVTCLGTDPGGAVRRPDAVDVMVLPAGEHEPARRELAEVAAALLAPLLRADTLVVVTGSSGLRRCGDVVAGTLGMLTGHRAGRDYPMGFATVGIPGTPALVSGVDQVSVERTTALFRTLGRRTSVVGVLAAAACAALAARAAGQPGPASAPGRGHTRLTTRPITAWAGTGPKSRESTEVPRSSPRT